MALAFVPACSDDEDRPLQGGNNGGGGGGGGNRIDGGTRADSGAGGDATQDVALQGSLCVLTDLRTPTANCASEQLLGIRIKDLATGTTTTTDAQGRFSLNVGGPSVDLLIGETQGDIRDSIYTVDLASVNGELASVPAVRTATWNDLLTAIDASEADDSATLAAYVLDNNTRVTGATIESSETTSAVLYGGNSSQIWNADLATGTTGSVLLFNVSAQDNNTSITVTADGTAKAFEGIPVRKNTLTFVTVDP